MRILAVASLVPVLFAASGGAQSPSIVSEAEFLSALGEGHPAIVARREALGEAEARAIAVGTLASPELGMIREAPSGGAEQLDITLSWQLPSLARRLELDSAARSIEAAEASYSRESLALRSELREAYASWALSTERSQALRSLAERLSDLARREQKRAERGEVSGLAAQRLALAASEARSGWAVAEAAAEKALGVVRGWRSDLPHDVAPERSPLPLPPAGLEGDHLALVAARQELAAARLSEQAAGRFVQLPVLLAGWQQQEVGTQSLEGPIFGVTWRLPLFDRNQADRTRAGVRVQAAAARAELLGHRLAAERRSAIAVYERLSTAAREAMKLAETSGRLVEGAVAAFRHGETSLTDLLETLRSVTSAVMTALDLHAAALDSHRDLERIAGHALDLAGLPLQADDGDSP